MVANGGGGVCARRACFAWARTAGEVPARRCAAGALRAPGVSAGYPDCHTLRAVATTSLPQMSLPSACRFMLSIISSSWGGGERRAGGGRQATWGRGASLRAQQGGVGGRPGGGCAGERALGRCGDAAGPLPPLPHACPAAASACGRVGGAPRKGSSWYAALAEAAHATHLVRCACHNAAGRSRLPGWPRRGLLLLVPGLCAERHSAPRRAAAARPRRRGCCRGC